MSAAQEPPPVQWAAKKSKDSEVAPTMKFRSLVVAGVAVSALAAAPAAMATDQTVSAVGGQTLSINTATAVIFSSLFTPNSTFSGTGTVAAVSTSPTWTLNVKDGTGDGHMQALNGVDISGLGLTGYTTAGTLSTCGSSESELANAPTVTASGVPVIGDAAGHTVTLSDTDQAVANSTTGVLPLTTLTTTLSQHTNAGEQLQAGCLYKVTATYSISAS